jgi:Zn-dependent peptidase ImmA (M78 family)
VFPSFKQITFAQCCEAAEEVRIKYWNSETIPVDVDHIIENGLRLTVIPVDGLRNDRDIYGFLSNCRSYVFVDSDVMITPKFEATLRFTMAHELGHYFLHREFYEAHTFTNVDGWKDLLRQIGGPNLIAYEWRFRNR